MKSTQNVVRKSVLRDAFAQPQNESSKGQKKKEKEKKEKKQKLFTTVEANSFLTFIRDNKTISKNKKIHGTRNLNAHILRFFFDNSTCVSTRTYNIEWFVTNYV